MASGLRYGRTTLMIGMLQSNPKAFLLVANPSYRQRYKELYKLSEEIASRIVTYEEFKARPGYEEPKAIIQGDWIE